MQMMSEKIGICWNRIWGCMYLPLNALLVTMGRLLEQTSEFNFWVAICLIMVISYTRSGL
jgi:hypothetical protein